MENFNITINSDSQNVNELLIITSKLGRMPNRIVLHDQYIGDKFESIIYKNVGDLDRLISSELIPVFDGHIVNERILSKIGNDIWCSYLKLEKDSGEFVIDNVCIYYVDHVPLEDIIQDLKSITVSYETESVENINILTFSNNSIDIEPLYLDDIDISELHLKKVVKDVKKTIKLINDEPSGITIIRGVRGTGKTSLSRYISQNLEMTTLILPLNLVDLTINNPDFKNFLKKFGKCLIVIDDCEYNYNPSKSKSYFTGNLLQFLETLKIDIHFMLIFNCDDDYEIDQDILDSDKVISEINLDLIDQERASSLSKKLGHSIEYRSDVTLSKVINGVDIDHKIKIGIF